MCLVLVYVFAGWGLCQTFGRCLELWARLGKTTLSEMLGGCEVGWRCKVTLPILDRFWCAEGYDERSKQCIQKTYPSHDGYNDPLAARISYPPPKPAEPDLSLSSTPSTTYSHWDTQPPIPSLCRTFRPQFIYSEFREN